MEDANTNSVPESFDWNETDLTRSSFPQLAEDFYKGVVTKAEPKICPYNDSKDIGLEITCAPMNAAGEVQKYTVRKWYGIPVANPKVPGHKVSEEKKNINGKELPSDKDTYYRNDRELIRAVEGDDALPRFPKRQENSDQYFDPATGDSLTKEEHTKREREINQKTLEKMKAYYINPGMLKDTILYFGVKHNGKGFANLSYVRHDEPSDRPVRYTDFTTK